MNLNSANRLLSRQPLLCSLQTPPLRTTLPRNLSRIQSQCPQRFYREAHRGRESRTQGPLNPLDPISAHRMTAIERARIKRRMNISLVGAIVSMIIPIVIVSNLDLEELEKNGKLRTKAQARAELERGVREGNGSGEATGAGDRGIIPVQKTDSPDKKVGEFAGKEVIVQPGTEKILATDPNDPESAIELVETGTSTIPHFPKTIQLPVDASKNLHEREEYTLLGLGIRTVSFLNIQVYVLGFYVRTSSLPVLQSSLIHTFNPIASSLIPSERQQLKSQLLDPDQSYELWDKLLEEGGTKSCWRIVPVRNTDFHHLRDGWVRGITARTQDAAAVAQKASIPSPYEDEEFAHSMKEFKALFRQGGGKAPKGSVLSLVRDEKGGLNVLFQKAEGKAFRDMGAVNDERIGRLVWLGYLGGKKISSEGARQSVVNGIDGLVERPVGTVETRVE